MPWTPGPGPTDGDDQFVGTDLDDNAQGGAGNDTLSGGAGNDLLSGQEGSDTLSGGDGDDSLHVGAGDIADGGSGDDIVAVEAPFLPGGGAPASISGGAGRDTLSTFGDILLTSFSAANGFELFQLNGSISGDAAANVLDFGALAPAIPGPSLTVNGEGGDDTIIASTTNDTIRGGGGGDILRGGAGDDVLFGASNGDSNSGLADAADTLEGGDGHDVLRGAEGDDVLRGGAGRDNLRGDLGADTLDGGAGFDQAAYRFDDIGATAGVTFDASAVVGSGTIALSDGRGGTDTLIGIESVILSGTHEHGDVFSGTAQGDSLTGFGGNDTLRGGGGSDLLAGGAGDDIMDGGADSSFSLDDLIATRLVLIGDMADLFDATVAITLDLSLGSVQTSGQGADTLIGIESLGAGSGADQLRGDVGRNALIGRAGGDIL